MAYDESTADRVRAALGPRRDLAEKKMMGALCFLIDGRICCGVAGSALLVRVGHGAFREMLTRPHVQPMEFAGRQSTSFVLVAAEGLRTERALAAWVNLGIDLLSRLPRKAAARRRETRRR
ncbi:MAG TPA: TfoX/Sxy family protein [Beijerinckiaceae bacterium]|nr:TfoX/Sxy family protein [Beijerinckiaceae bacterium]